MIPVESLILPILALLVSIWAAWNSRRTAKEQTVVQQRLLALETSRERDRLLDSRRARLRAEIVKRPEEYIFAIRNEGNGQARAIRALVDGKAIGDHDTILNLGRKQAVHTLGPGAEARYLAAITFGSPMVYNVELSWEDDTGEPGRWQSQVTI